MIDVESTARPILCSKLTIARRNRLAFDRYTEGLRYSLTMGAFDRIGFIGAGRVARTLAPLLAEQGSVVTAVSSRCYSHAATLAADVPGSLAYETPQAAVDASDLVFLTVADDAIESVCSKLDWKPRHAVVHCSGATEITVLASASGAGAQIGGFHPLQIFSDPVNAMANLAGSYVAVEAESTLRDRLTRIAAALGLLTLDLPPGSRAAYHLGANLAASGLLAVLDEAESAWRIAGLSADALLPALMPLARGTLNTATQLGLSKAVSGPIARGDSAVLASHLIQAGRLPRGEAFYLELLARLLMLRRKTRSLDPEMECILDNLIATKPS